MSETRPAPILGIDPGTRATGYGVIAPGRTRSEIVYLSCGVIRLNPKKPLAERLAILYRELNDVIARFGPKVMAVEQIFVSRNADSALKLGHARGVALLAAEHKELPIHSYQPTLVKQSVVGHGHATKHQVQQMIKLLCGLEKAPASDAADALAVAICHYHHASSLLNRNRLQ